MHTKNQTHRLASIFLVASLAFNIATPPVSGESSDSGEPPQDPGGEIRMLKRQLERQDDAFLEPLGPEFQPFDMLRAGEYIDYLMIGDTSFLATKFPPSKEYVVISRQWLFVTAYSSTPDQTDDSPFITASGSHVRDGIVAANFAYFDTKLRFPTLYGDKIFVVEDRMNTRYPYRVDIWMRTREEAKQFGVKIVPIEIIREI